MLPKRLLLVLLPLAAAQLTAQQQQRQWRRCLGCGCLGAAALAGVASRLAA
jgi:hypothetical protein